MTFTTTSSDRWTTPSRWALAGAVFATLALAAAIASAGDLAQRLGEISTPADHLAVARSLDARAAEFERLIEEHKQMLRVYRGPIYALPDAGLRMRKHCEAAIRGLNNALAAVRALAAEHRKLAREGDR